MAVQAQYPSNLLFVNRNVQEEKAQIGGEGFVDQSQILFSNGVGGYPRKRTREIITANSSSPIDTLAIQPQPSQFIDLRLAFGEQQQQSLSSQSSVFNSVFSDELAPQIRHHRDEIEQFLHAQGEQLRRTLAAKRQSHYHALLRAAEEFASQRLREKEAEAGKAVQRNAELEAQATRLATEARAWQARARAGEAAASALQAQLQQAVMGGASAQDTAADGEDAESGFVDPDRVVPVDVNVSRSAYGAPTCKACGRGVASVVLLPCRHLSLCTACDRSVTNQACPVCFSFKESSVEVYFS